MARDPLIDDMADYGLFYSLAKGDPIVADMMMDKAKADEPVRRQRDVVANPVRSKAAPTQSAKDVDALMASTFGEADERVDTRAPALDAIRKPRQVNDAVDQYYRGKGPGGRGSITAPAAIDPSLGSLARGGVANVKQMGESLEQISTDALGDVINPAAQAMQRREMEQAQAETVAVRPQFESNVGEGLYGVGESIIQMLPGLAASVATGNPGPAIAWAGASSGTQAYGKYRARGATPGEAALGGIGEGSIEAATELIPMGKFLDALGAKNAKGFIVDVGKSVLFDVPGEQIATLAQDAIDTAIANPNKTWGQYFAERKDSAIKTLITTIGQGAVMAGGGAGIRKAIQTKPETTVEAGVIADAFNPDPSLVTPRIGTRPTPPGEIAAASALAVGDITPEDEASPLPTEFIAQGKAVIGGAMASTKADEILTTAGLPRTLTRVEIRDPDGNVLSGTIDDAFSGETGSGVHITLDDGRKWSEHFDDITDAGVSITPIRQTADEITASMAQEAEASGLARDTALDSLEMPAPLASGAQAEGSERSVPAPLPSTMPANGNVRDNAITFIMNKLEGGSKRVVDSGGVTRFGISKNANPDVDVENLTEAQAKQLYIDRYWNKLGLTDNTDPTFAVAAMDAAINHGVGGARALIEKSGGTVDGLFQARRDEYARLIRENPGKYARYEKGWENRLQRLAGEIGMEGAGAIGSPEPQVAAAEEPYTDPYAKPMEEYQRWQEAQDAAQPAGMLEQVALPPREKPAEDLTAFTARVQAAEQLPDGEPPVSSSAASPAAISSPTAGVDAGTLQQQIGGVAADDVTGPFGNGANVAGNEPVLAGIGSPNPMPEITTDKLRVRIEGITPEQVTQINAALPEGTTLTVRSDGGYSAPKKYEAVVRGAVSDVAPVEAVEAERSTPIAGFTTAKGSTYVVHEDGTTTRNKAARADPGHEGDSGEKSRTLRTVYVDGDASVLSAAGLNGLGPKGARVIVDGDRASLLMWNESQGRWGISPSSRDIKISDTPAVGLSPLELWKKADDVPGREAYANMHAGNAITAISQPSVTTADGGDVPSVSAVSPLRRLIDSKETANVETAAPLATVRTNKLVAIVSNVSPDVVETINAALPDGVTLTQRSDGTYSAPKKYADTIKDVAGVPLDAAVAKGTRAADQGPLDILKFVARNGGLSFDGLNEQSRTDKLREGHDLRNSGSLKTFVPGAGPLLRKNGLSLDDMGERLWDAGYFGPPETTPRPTDNEIIQTLDTVIRRKEKRYSSFDPGQAAKISGPTAADADMVDTEVRGARTMAIRDAWDDAAAKLGLAPMFQSEIDQVRSAVGAGSETMPALGENETDPDKIAAYIIATANRELEEVRIDAWHEVEDELYAATEDEFSRATAAEDQDGGTGVRGPAPDAGDEGSRARRGEDGPGRTGSDEGVKGLDREKLETAGDNSQVSGSPASANREGRASNADEEAGQRLDLGERVDPAIATRQRQETQLRAEAPLRKKAEQDGTMGLGLFDTADQPQLGLDTSQPAAQREPSTRDTVEPAQAAATGPEADTPPPASAPVAGSDPKQSRTEPASREAIQARIDQLGVSDKVKVALTDLIDGNPAIAGTVRGNIITLAMDSRQSPEMTINHEIVHAMKAMRLFRDAEWTALSRDAAKDGKLMESVARRYPKLAEDARIEEAIADRFMAWTAGNTERGFIQRAFERAAEFIRAIGQVFRGQGFTTSEAVMRAIEAGKVGGREATATDGETRYSITEPLNDAGHREFDKAGAIPAKTNAMVASLPNPKMDAIRDTIDDWRVVVQDKMLPVLRTQEKVAATLGRKIAEAENAYLAEELMTGKVGARLEKLAEERIDPLFQAMHTEGVSVDELETFLYARHAKERNARIAKINPEFSPGEGSGMTDTQARAILARIDKAGKREVMDALASYVDQMNTEALQTRVEAGLLSEEEAGAWRETYKHYVPLRGKAEVETDRSPERPRTQSGMSVKGKESRRAFGRRSEADNILAYAILQAEEAIIRAEKNHVAQSFLKMAQANPDPGFWEVNKIERRPVMDKTTGLVRYELQSRLSAEDAEYTVTAKVGGDEFRVTMNRDKVMPVKVAEAMRNLDNPKFNRFMAAASTFGHYFSAISTRYNPAFVVTNSLRDAQTLAVISQQYESEMPGFTLRVFRDYFKAMAADTVIGRTVGSKAYDANWSKWRAEWQLAGGKVYYNQSADVDQIRKQLSLRSKRLANPNAAAKVWTGVFDLLEGMNESVERAIRLSVYKNAREMGKSKAEAASMARNVTVNFTRRGKLGPVINAFYVFFNAAVQGNANLVLAAVKSKRVRAAMGGFIVAGFLSDMLNSMLSGDDDDGEAFWDKMPDHEKARNAVFMMPGGDNGQAIKIPLSYGLNALFGLGRNASAMMRGAMKPGEAIMGSAMEFADAFNPIGNGGSWLNILAPTLLDPAIDITENKDFTGKPIQPEANPFSPPETPSNNFFPNVNPLARKASSALNSATGGDEVLPGAASVSPEVLEYLTGFLTGGAGRFLMDTSKLATAPFDPDAEVTPRDIPFVKSVVTEKGPWIDKAKYYDRIHEVRAVIDHAKQYGERGDAEGLSKFVASKAQIGRMEAATKEADRIMRQVRKARNETRFQHELGRLDDATYRERMDAVTETEERVIAAYNRRWNDVVEPE